MVFERTKLVLAFIGVVLVPWGTVAQQATVPVNPSQATPPPTQTAVPPVEYSVDVSLVEVDAVVTDAAGRVIRDLNASDFQILEDGKLQTIDRASFIEIPIERAEVRAPAAAVADVQSNLHRFDGRLYVLLLDDLHTAAARSARVKAAARAFIERSLEPGDLAAVVHVSGARASQDFTTDRRLLLASIDRFAGRQLRSQTLNEIDDYNRKQLSTGRTPENVTDIDEGPRAHDARTTFDALAGIARRLAPVRGRRKALLWFGEGVSYDMFDTMGRGQASIVRESSRAAIGAASAANMAIYGVDARGGGGLGEEAVQLSSPAVDPTSGHGASALGQELLRSQDNLRRVANDTGGFAVTNTDEIPQAFDRVVAENSAYYLLAYYPSATRRDGAFRRLEVRVNRQGARVRARSGYIAAPQKKDTTPSDEESGAPAALREALLSPVPQSALPMAVQVAPFKGNGDKASVFVTVEYGALAFDDSGVVAPDRDRLDSSVIAVDPAGKVAQSDHSTITLNVKPETRHAMRVLGFRTHSRLELPPGRYQIRAAGLMAGKGLVGSVHDDVEVPDFSKPALSMSGLVLTSRVAGYTPTARFDPRMREVLPAPPSAVRDFRNDEAIALFAEVYGAGGVPPSGVVLTTRIRNHEGKAVFEREDPRTAEELTRTKDGYSLQVSLRQFPPGDYVLRLEAASQGDRSNPVARETAFRIWDVAQGASSPDRAAAAQSASLPFVTVAKGAVSGVTDARQSIARSDTEWQALWQSLSIRGAQPVVKFDNTMIVALFLGSRPTAGYESEVVGLRRDGDVLIVEWQEHTPRDPGNPLTQTTPFLLVGVPQHAGEVRFERVGAVADRD